MFSDLDYPFSKTCNLLLMILLNYSSPNKTGRFSNAFLEIFPVKAPPKLLRVMSTGLNKRRPLAGGAI